MYCAILGIDGEKCNDEKYTLLGLEDAKNEMVRLEELNRVREEVEKTNDEKPMEKGMFRVV